MNNSTNSFTGTSTGAPTGAVAQLNNLNIFRLIYEPLSAIVQSQALANANYINLIYSSGTSTSSSYFSSSQTSGVTRYKLGNNRYTASQIKASTTLTSQFYSKYNTTVDNFLVLRKLTFVISGSPTSNTDGSTSKTFIKVEFPIIMLCPPTQIAVDSFSIEFTMKITQNTTSEQTGTAFTSNSNFSNNTSVSSSGINLVNWGNVNSWDVVSNTNSSYSSMVGSITNTNSSKIDATYKWNVTGKTVSNSYLEKLFDSVNTQIGSTLLDDGDLMDDNLDPENQPESEADPEAEPDSGSN